MTRTGTTETFIKRATEIHGDKYDYSKVEYKSITAKVIILCKLHGEFEQKPVCHINNKCICPFCSGNYKHTSEDFIQKSLVIHGDKYDYSKVDYKKALSKVIIVCKLHGQFFLTPSCHLKGRGCRLCGTINSLKKRTSNTQSFILKAREVHGEKYDYSKLDYKNNHTKVIIICKEHGEFEQIPSNHLAGSICHKCSGHYQPTTEEFILKAKEVHGERYNYSKVDYKNNHTKVNIICKKHDKFKQTPSCHLSGQGCPVCSGHYKHTIEDFLKKAKEIHGDIYNYSKVVYEKSNEKVTIECKLHGQFQQTPNCHLLGHGCSLCGNIKGSMKLRSTTEEFIEKAKEVHGETYDYTKALYETSKQKIIIICKEHGEFLQTPHCHLSGQGCSLCGDIKGSMKRTSNTEEFIKRSVEFHGEMYDYSKVNYITNHEKVIIICKVHGEFQQIPNCHLSGNGCRSCQYVNNGVMFRTSQDEFIAKAKEVHGETYDYTKAFYETCMKKIIIICKEHGEFQQSPNAHISHNHGCPRCFLKTHHSKMENDWLNFISKYYSLRIQQFQNGEEFKIPGTRYKADGYCAETNTVYEFHGDYWHGNPAVFSADHRSYFGVTFGELYEKTMKRENEIRNLGYNVVNMWEFDWKKINRNILKFQKRCRNNKNPIL